MPFFLPFYPRPSSFYPFILMLLSSSPIPRPSSSVVKKIQVKNNFKLYTIRMNNNSKYGILLFHDFPAEYIKTSLVLANYKLFDLNSTKIIVVTNVNNIVNFIGYMNSLKYDLRNFEFNSYSKFNNTILVDSKWCKNKIIVIDQIQTYHNKSKIGSVLVDALNYS